MSVEIDHRGLGWDLRLISKLAELDALPSSLTRTPLPAPLPDEM